MAKRFKFRLEPMLALRRRQADTAKRVVAQRLGRISQARRQIDLLQEQIVQQVQAMRSGPLVGPLDIGRIARHRAWLAHLQRGVFDGMARMRQLQTELVKERAALAEASKRVKIIETLRDRQQQRYYKELDRLETIEADEMSIQRYVHDHASE